MRTCLSAARVIAVLASASAALLAQQSPLDLADRFVVPEGVEVTLWAESPMLFNPTALDVDARGRIWATEGVNYRKWNGRNPGRSHPEGDRVVILEDTDGDGACDSTKVFVQDKELVSPLGIAVLGNRVYVSSSPNLFIYTDTDGDDVADEREVFLTGFGGFNHDHGLHSIIEGPDGKLYFNAGNAGPHVVTDKAGWQLRSGSIYRGGGPKAAPNRPGLRSDDGRAWTGGLVMRIGADGAGLEVLAHNFRNPYEVTVDAFGNMFQSDNDDDGNRGCRTLWVMRGGNNGFFSADGKRSWQADRRPGQNTQRAHWHQDDPGVVPAGCINGAGGPTGVAMFESGLLPASFRGSVLNCDAGRSLVYSHKPMGRGAGFELEPRVLIEPKPGDKSKWFRPSDVVVGTEGAVYVADWYDPGVGGHGAGDRQAYGRILRLAVAGAPKRTTPVTIANGADAITALNNPAINVRSLGRRWLIEHKALDVLRRQLTASHPAARARALWVLAVLGDESALDRAARGEDESQRLVALRARPRFAKQLASDPSPAIRREVALGLAELPSRERLALLESIAKSCPPGDRAYLEAVGIGAHGIEEPLFVRLLTAQDPDPRKWDQRFADLVWRLHPSSCVPALMTRVMATELSRQQRTQAIDTLAFIPTRQAAEGMIAAAEGGPTDTRSHAFWWVKHRGTNDWRAFQLTSQLGIDKKNAVQLFTSGVMKKGKRAIDVDLAGSATVWLTVGDAGNGNACDWADWIDPKLTGPAGELSLLDHGWVGQSVGWGSLGRNKNATGKPLAIDGQRFERGIGVHANSEIMFRVPDGYDRLVATVGPDDGGTRQGNSATSIVFSVHGAMEVEAKVDPRITSLASTLLNQRAKEDAKREAAQQLTSTRAGGEVLLGLAAAGKLGEREKTFVAYSIFRSPDQTVRALASRYFERPGRSTPLPPIDQLTAMRGNAHRGSELFFSPKATCSTCHIMQGRGGVLGPDMTRIRDKLDSAGLLDALLNPSAAISFGYESWVVEMEDGAVHLGYVLADGDNLVIKDMNGQRHVLDAKKVARRQKQASSLMPDTVSLGLTAQDIADITAYMLAEPFDNLKLGDPVRLLGGSNLSGWKAIKTDGIWKAVDGVLSTPGRPIGYIRTTADYTNYVLTLEWRTPPGKPPGNSGVLLRMTGQDKVWPDSIEAQLHSKNAGDIWNIGKYPMQVAKARTRGRRTIKLHSSNEKPLGEWNRYEIILNKGDLRLTVNGLVQNEASFCAVRPGKICLQSEGAAIEFRNIVLRPILD